MHQSTPARRLRVVVAGGGAAGFFAAIAAAESCTTADVTLLEKTPHLLAKVRISGGGRCNVTHACFDVRELATRYPRGGRALIGPLTRFGPSETIEWFESRGVALKTEADGRMFPVSDSSQSIIDCLNGAAQRAGVMIRVGVGVDAAVRNESGEFALGLSDGTTMLCDRFLWAGGGCRPGSHPAVGLGHSLVAPVPSLFTFQIDEPWLKTLPGVAVDPVKASVSVARRTESGPLLITHGGVSGPVVLRLSAWGARELHEVGYRFEVEINWLASASHEDVMREIQNRRVTSGAQTVLRARWSPLPARLWEQLVALADIAPDMRWSKLSREASVRLAKCLTKTTLTVSGKSTNKEEFVTCGGIPLDEVRFKTMESRLVPGLYFAGEALDIDGITGGFNFQSAWTTGWTAGRAMVGVS